LVHTFDNVRVIVFVASLSCYNLSDEIHGTNCMEDQIRLFGEIINSVWFEHRPIFLILTKRDVLRQNKIGFAHWLKSKEGKRILGTGNSSSRSSSSSLLTSKFNHEHPEYHVIQAFIERAYRYDRRLMQDLFILTTVANDVESCRSTWDLIESFCWKLPRQARGFTDVLIGEESEVVQPCYLGYNLDPLLALLGATNDHTPAGRFVGKGLQLIRSYVVKFLMISRYEKLGVFEI
jgi:hypothetical protein